MKYFQKWPMALSRFFRAQEGSALPIIGLGLIMLVGATGAAIDMGRLQIVQSRMQNALDAAGLAVGSEISTTNLTSETSKYFYANFPASYLGTTITSGPTATPNADNTVITLSVSGTVSTTLMKIFGKSNFAVSATSQITRQSKGMELVLVIDNTGSMSDSAGGGVSKISAAKSAAISMLNILYGTNSNTSTNLWVGLVPFAQAVNIGTANTAWLDSTYDATLNWAGNSWEGCVESRSNGTGTPQYDITDDPPSVVPFKMYYWPDDSVNNWSTTTPHTVCSGSWQNPTCNTTYTTSYDYGYSNTLGDNKGPNALCSQPMTPMVAEKNTVVTAINAMTAAGDTHIDLGLAWGWRMLSPRWQNLWGGEMNSHNLPLAYNTPLMNKVVILMTDGDNTIINGYYSGYGYPSDGQLGPHACSGNDCSTGMTEINTRTTSVCSAMKANGIIIYTIALGSQVSSTGQALLLACATSPSYYFLSPTTNELQGIFQQIGDSLANLRISQ